MSKIILVIPDQHAHPDHNNDRADWLARLIIDIKPDIVVNGGDAADMPSLSDYDKGKRSFHGRSYKADLLAHLDFQDRLWSPVKATKKKMPYRIVLEGNHEHRVERVLDLSPELKGTVGFENFLFEDYYHEVVRYDGSLPGIFEAEGILFAHFYPTGISGRPLGGERPGHMLLAKNGHSSVAFHSHLLDFATRRTVSGKTLNGLVAGCYQDYINEWAGPVGKFWRAGVSILSNVSDGNFDYQFVSIETLRDVYGDKSGRSNTQAGSFVAKAEQDSQGSSNPEVSAKN
ncbi:MAG: metallophosphoesterase [Candidatus Obscuribacterales bacterium]